MGWGGVSRVRLLKVVVVLYVSKRQMANGHNFTIRACAYSVRFIVKSIIFQNYRIETIDLQSRGNRHTLTIRNVTYNDLGNYTCQASNTLGKDRASLTLSGIPSVCTFDSVSILIVPTKIFYSRGK